MNSANFRNTALTTLIFAFALIAVRNTHADVGEKSGQVKIQKKANNLHITIDGQPFFTYQYNTDQPELPRPVIHPLHGPEGQVITQMGEVAGKRVAHFHHTGLWISHQNFTQGNNWQMDADPNKKPRRRSRLLHRSFARMNSGKVAQFVEHLQWDSIDGKTILLDETRTVTIPHRPANRRVIDFEIVLRAKQQAITLQRTPYQILAVRALNSMVPRFNKKAVITNSNGQKNPKTGVLAKWIDVTGEVNGKTVGIALFNHPENLRHPTPCLSFAKQTIGLSPTHLESYTLEPGKELHLRFRVLVHAGNVAEAKVAGEYADYVK